MLWRGGSELNYLDMVEKATYYKERIMKSFLQKGMFPNKMTVQKKLDDLNMRLAIYRHKAAASGENFNADDFNAGMEAILQDLRILYTVALKLSIDEYNNLQSYLDSHLTELETFARHCERKAKFEIGSSYLGETVFIQTYGFNISRENSTATIDLGEIVAPMGGKIACLFDGRDISPDNVLFKFGNQYCSSYALNSDFITVPGTAEVKQYDYETSKDIIVNDAQILKPEGLVAKDESDYIIYAGKDEVMFTPASSPSSTPIHHFYEKKLGQNLTFDEGGRLEFRITNGSYIHFDYSVAPTTQNFSGSAFDTIDKTDQKIILEFDKPFTIGFDTNGQIYAVKRRGTTEKGTLIYPYFDELHTFHIVEYNRGDMFHYKDVTVTVSNLLLNAPLVINMIGIKLLSTSGKEEEVD